MSHDHKCAYGVSQHLVLPHAPFHFFVRHMVCRPLCPLLASSPSVKLTLTASVASCSMACTLGPAHVLIKLLYSNARPFLQVVLGVFDRFCALPPDNRGKLLWLGEVLEPLLEGRDIGALRNAITILCDELEELGIAVVG